MFIGTMFSFAHIGSMFNFQCEVHVKSEMQLLMLVLAPSRELRR